MNDGGSGASASLCLLALGQRVGREACVFINVELVARELSSHVEGVVSRRSGMATHLTCGDGEGAV